MNTIKTFDQFLHEITQGNMAEIDATWAILKYAEIGIKRKLECWGLIWGYDIEGVLGTAPQEDGRILDKATRHLVHDVLIERSNILNSK